jgi:hypothetical protein
MTSKELTQIKKYQREFKKQFNKELAIDFVAMNGVVNIKRIFDRENFNKKEADKILNRMCQKYHADINIIKDREKRLAFNYPNETKAIGFYVKECLNMKWGLNDIMVNINRERTNGYFYIRKFKNKIW